MTDGRLGAIRAALLGRTWTLGEGGTWVCDNVAWTGLRCAVALNDGQGGYLDLTLEDTSARGVAAFAQRVGELLRRRAVDRATLIVDDREER